MEKSCDNTSVGVVVEDSGGNVLLINRAKFPYGWAAPAGHIDEHGSAELTAVNEVYEETGLVLVAESLNKVIVACRVDNICRRTNGDHHIWTVYQATVDKTTVNTSPDEVRNSGWFSRSELQVLADQSKQIASAHKQDRDKILEGVWINFLAELGYIQI